jgi:hypothetical protein
LYDGRLFGDTHLWGTWLIIICRADGVVDDLYLQNHPEIRALRAK